MCDLLVCYPLPSKEIKPRQTTDSEPKPNRQQTLNQWQHTYTFKQTHIQGFKQTTDTDQKQKDNKN